MPDLTDVDVSSLEHFLASWYGPPDQPSTVPPERAGAPALPGPLRGWYAVTSRYRRPLTFPNTVLPPDQVYQDAGKLVFWVENQQVYLRAADPHGEDPMVHERANVEGEPWHPTGVPLSGSCSPSRSRKPAWVGRPTAPAPTASPRPRPRAAWRRFARCPIPVPPIGPALRRPPDAGVRYPDLQRVVAGDSRGTHPRRDPAPDRRHHRHRLGHRPSRRRPRRVNRPGGFVDGFARHVVSPRWRLVIGASRVGAVRRVVEVLYDRVAGPGPPLGRGRQPSGEPWTFGLDPAEVPDFLARRGFGMLRDVSTAEAGERYFTPLGRRERGSRLYHVVTASTHDGGSLLDEAHRLRAAWSAHSLDNPALQPVGCRRQGAS